MLVVALADRLDAWRTAGLIDEATAARIAAFEADRARSEAGGSGIAVGEIIAYAGSVVLLVGIGFLYGIQYAGLGSGGRLALIGAVVLGSLGAGWLVRRAGATEAADRARAAGWAVASLGVAAWFTQAFVDWRVLTHVIGYPGSGVDPNGPLMLGSAIGFVVAAVLLWRAGAWIVALSAGILAYTAAGAFVTYHPTQMPWAVELAWLVPAAVLVLLSETLILGGGRRGARELLRFSAVVPPVVAALVLTQADGSLEWFAGALSAAALGAAILRGSGGYAVGGGLALFLVVNEVGFRHFAQAVGFPVVLIASGATLLVVAAGLFRLLPRLRGTV
jgi:hypothetical protein